MTKRDFLKSANVVKNGNQYYAIVYQVMCQMSDGTKFGMDCFFNHDDAQEFRNTMCKVFPDDIYYIIIHQLF